MDEQNVQVADNIRPYLDEIAERLWSEHAAVMVGSGFSKNGQPNSEMCNNFPDWAELGDIFYEKVYGKHPGKQVKYLNVLKLAEEVQAAFGRPTLDQLLQDAIPDKEYEPSELHTELLNLPWSDVFTTNYDTLLERATAKVFDRRYDIVKTKEDITHSSQPRIVKLHGSFPSIRPFVITEEDYRIYPKENAPFVNMVQQSLLENTLCLIGFSGDDPNFLSWIGWIRDNLGRDNSPKIFLVGVINLSIAQQKLLEARNIVVINMADCNDIRENEHYKGLMRFLEYLKSKANSQAALNWPTTSSPLFPKHGKDADKEKQIETTLKAWKVQRESYPGWVIAPEDNRKKLWSYTEYWLLYINEKDNLSEKINIEWMYELVWRMDKCLCPILGAQATFFSEILSRRKKAIFHECEVISNDFIQESGRWIDLEIHMMRYYRIQGFLQDWKRIDDELEELSDRITHLQKALIHYERCLFALFRIDIAGLKERIEEWTINESLPFMEAKRAMLISKVGNNVESLKIISNMMDQLRSKMNLQPIGNDIGLLSREGYMMMLHKYVSDTASTESIKGYQDRWNQIRQIKCDPWNELKLFEGHLEHQPRWRKDETTTFNFDIGRITTKHHWEAADSEAFKGFSFLRFFEDAGLIFRLGVKSIGIKSGEGAVKRIAKYSPYWATAMLFQIEGSELMTSLYGRVSISVFSQQTANNLVKQYLSIIEESKRKIDNKSWKLRCSALEIIQDILSRLCTKCSTSALFQILDVIVLLYGSKEIEVGIISSNLLDRLIHSWDVSQITRLVEQSINIHTPKCVSHNIENQFLNPFYYLADLPSSLVKCIDIQSMDSIEKLLREADGNDKDVRHWAKMSLCRLYEWGLLGKMQQQKLGKILWKRTDQYGLPVETDSYKFYFHKLPHPKNKKPRDIFLQYLRDSEFPIQAKKKDRTISCSGGYVELCEEILGANRYNMLSVADIDMICKRIIEWWDFDKEELRKEEKGFRGFGSVLDEFQGRFSKMEKVLAYVIVPRAQEYNRVDLIGEASRIQYELHERNMPTLRLQAALSLDNKEKLDQILIKLNGVLSSTRPEEVSNALQALTLIFEVYDRDDKELVFSNIMSRLSKMIYWRHSIKLDFAISLMSRIVLKHPQLMNGDIEENTLSGLEHLLVETNYNCSESEIAERLLVRREAAELAALIYKKNTNAGKRIPSAIQSWKDNCESIEEFAEIRNAWKEHLLP